MVKDNLGFFIFGSILSGSPWGPRTISFYIIYWYK